MTGYTRESSGTIVDGAVIEAAEHNAEFDALEAAFDAATGHSHGAAGEGAPIDLTSAVDGILPVTNGGTGGATPAAARTALELSSADSVDFLDITTTSFMKTGDTTTAGRPDPSSLAGGSLLYDTDEDALIFTDGNFWNLVGTGSGNSGYKGTASGFFFGAPEATESITRFVVTQDFLLPSGLTDSQGLLEVAATAETDFDIQVNGASKGIMRFAISGTVATFIFASAVAMTAGDVLEILAPGTPDATAENLSFSIQSSKSSGSLTAIHAADFYLDTGPVNAYDLTATGLTVAPESYTDGFKVAFIPAVENTGAATIDVEGLGPKQIVSGGAPLVGGEIPTNLVAEARYSTTSGKFEVTNLLQAVAGDISSLSDVDTTGVSEGDILTFQSGEWNVLSHTIRTLEDVSGSAPSDNNILRFNTGSGLYENEALTASSIDDIDTSGATEGQGLTLQSGTWQPSNLVGDLSDLSDVDTSGATEGQALTLQSGTWQPSGIATSTRELSDVEVAAPSDNNIMRFNSISGDFENEALNASALDDVDTAGVGEGDILTLQSGEWNPSTNSTRNLADVEDVLPNDGDTIVWSTSNGQYEPTPSAQLPIGFIFLSTVITNPASLLGYGTWTAVGEGRMLIGVGTGDSGHTITAAEKGGLHEVGLTAVENGPHTHTVRLEEDGGTPFGNAAENGTGNFLGNLATSSSGSGTPHENLPPYLGIYMYERTA